MARTYNPYASQYEGAIRAAGELGQQFLKSTNPAAGIEAEALGWQANKDRQSALDSIDARGGRKRVGSMISGYDPADPNTWDPAQLAGAAVSSGAFDADPKKLGSLFQVLTGNLPGMSAEQRAGAYVGAGNAISPKDAFSPPDREFVRGEIQKNTLAQDRQQQLADMQQAFGVQGMENDSSMRELQWKTQNSPFTLSNGQGRYGPLGEEIANRPDPDGPGGSGGSGGGANGGPGVYEVTPGQARYMDAQDSFADILSPMLAEMGVPSDEEDNLRTELLPPGYFDQIVQTATDAARRDNFRRAKAWYVQNALRSQSEVPGGYTEDSILAEEELTMQPGGRQVAPEFRGLMQQQGRSASAALQQPAAQGPGGLPVVVSDADYEALPPGAMFQDETGQQFRKPAE